MSLDLRRLKLGSPAAERDKALVEYFVESESFRRLRGGERCIVLGNRGSGKSAIFQMIAHEERNKGSIVLALAPEDYSYELLQEALAAEKSGSWVKQGAYTAAWKYAIYVAVMRELSSSGPRFKRGPHAKIYEYIRDNHRDFEKNPIGALLSFLKRLEGFKLGDYEAAVKTRELQRLYKLQEIADLLPLLNSACEERKAVVLVDELDKGWDASEDAIAFVAGLFQAAISIRQHTPNVRVYLSLRKELYDNIPSLYEDAQKVRDLVEEITWDEPALSDLMNRRISYSISPGCQPSDSQGAWEAVFTGTLDYRQSKSFNYMIDRTLYRPREIIQFASDAISTAVNRGQGAPIGYLAISEAELSYSEQRLKDIAAEYRFQYPGLLSIFETFRGMTYNFEREDLELHCLRIATGETRISENALWCQGTDHDDMIQILWRVGFLRAQAVGGLKARRRSGSEFLGSHQISGLNLQGVSRFHVHPMFRSFLAMKENKK